MKIYLFVYYFFFFCFFSEIFPSDTARWQRNVALGGTGICMMGSLLWLQQVWYAPYNTGNFHFFDDSEEWLQMDKAGHAFTAFQVSSLLRDWYRSKGIKHAGWWSAGITFGYLTTIEIMDGFSSGWGFSRADFWCNVAGLTLSGLKEWECMEDIKFSYSYIARSDIYKERPEVLGKNLAERLIKDYNNQVYWLAYPVFGESRFKILRPWMIALGYGADGMRTGYPVMNDNRTRNLYISLDLDLEKIPFRKKWMKKTARFMNVLKFPFPTLMLSRKGVFFLWIR